MQLRVGDNENAEHAFRAAIEAFPEQSVSRRAELMQKVARTLQNRFLAQAALETLRSAEAVLEGAPGHRELCASIHIDRAWIHYWHGEVAEMETALAKSCNTAFGEMAGQLGANKLRRQAEKFGFNDPGLQVPMPVETA